MTEAVIFDHDGVIIDNQPAQTEAWRKLFQEFEIDISSRELKEKVRGRSTLDGLRNFFGTRFSNDELAQIAQRKEKLYMDIFQKDFIVVNGFTDFIRQLYEANIPIAIATSTTAELLRHTIGRLQLHDTVSAMVTAEEVTKSKPDPQVYELAAKKLGVPSNKCVVFEDSLSGVLSAKAAGARVILVMTSHTPNELPPVDLAIKDFTEVTASIVRSLV